MLDKEKVKNLYLNGYNAVQIANQINAKVEAVRKCIQRNYKEFRDDNRASKIRNKEVQRITEYESKQFMSDMVFIKGNRSIYKTDEEGDIILDKSIAPVVTYDTPRRLKNENSKRALDTRLRKSGYRKENILFNS